MLIKSKKTEAITSAAWLSASAQTLGFAPPLHNGFAISENILLTDVHKFVRRSTGFHLHLTGLRSKIELGDKLHIENKADTPLRFGKYIEIIIYNFQAFVNWQ